MNFPLFHCWGLKSNGIDYSHHVCVWPSGKEKKRNVSLWTPYMRVVVICIWGEEAIKRPNWRGRGGVILRAESRHWVKRSWCELQSHFILRVESRHWVKRSCCELHSHVILRAESRHWIKRSWCELQSRVILKVGASSIVGVKEFQPLFSLQLPKKLMSINLLKSQTFSCSSHCSFWQLSKQRYQFQTFYDSK